MKEIKKERGKKFIAEKKTKELFCDHSQEKTGIYKKTVHLMIEGT